MRARSRFLCLFAVLCSLSAGGASADSSALADSARRATPQRIPLCPTPLDTVHVVGQRPARRQVFLRQTPFASLLDVDQVRGPAESAPDLLERCAGLSVRRYGGPGAMATLSIRGADAGQVEIFLDRTPLRTAAQGMVDLNALDLNQVESIEIYRSGAPTELGGEASSSAIRLVTRSGGPRTAQLRISAGSYRTQEIDASASGAWRGQRYFFAASRFVTRGSFLYRSDNGTSQETADDAWLHWTNGDAVRTNLFGKLTAGLPLGLSLEGSTQHASRDQGIPGTSRQPTHEVRLETRTWLHRAEIAPAPAWHGPWRPTLYGFLESTDRGYRDPLRELNVTGTPRQVDQEQARAGVGVHLKRAWSAPLPALGIHHLEALAELRREVSRTLPPPGRPEEDRRTRHARLLSLGDGVDLLGGGLGLTAFYRWERSSDNFTGADPWRPFAARPEHVARVQGPSLGARLSLGRGHTLKANWARQARFPTFSELFGYAGTMQGNPALQPESGSRQDLGWTWEPERGPLGMRWRTEGVFYRSDLERMIVFVTVSDRETRPLNLDRARIRGAELSLTLDELPLLRALRPALAGYLHWQDARDEGASPVYHGKQLTYHPPWQAHARCDLTRGRWQVTYAAQYRAASYWGRSNLPQFRGAAQQSEDLTLRYRLARRGLTAALRLENLRNRPLEDVRGYPLPGRSWFLEIEWRTHPAAADLSRAERERRTEERG